MASIDTKSTHASEIKKLDKTACCPQGSAAGTNADATCPSPGHQPQRRHWRRPLSPRATSRRTMQQRTTPSPPTIRTLCRRRKCKCAAARTVRAGIWTGTAPRSPCPSPYAPCQRAQVPAQRTHPYNIQRAARPAAVIANKPPVDGWVSPCGVSLLVVFPPGVFGGCAPSGLPTMLSIMMSPHAEPTSGCSAPDSGWQSAAARPRTTLSVPAPGRPPGHRHASGAWPATAEQCSTQNDQGLPTPRAGSEYEDDLRGRGAKHYAPTDAERYAATDADFKSSGT